MPVGNFVEEAFVAYDLAQLKESHGKIYYMYNPAPSSRPLLEQGFRAYT